LGTIYTMLLRLRYFVVLAAFSLNSLAQTTFPTNGAPNPVHTIYAFTNAVIHIDYETTITNGTLVFQDGKIIAAAEKAVVPQGAMVYDLKGKHIYPSFIDLYSNYGLPEVSKEKTAPAPSQNKGAYGWNPSIKADVEAYKTFSHNKEKADELRKCGIGIVLTSQKDGIVRGSGSLVHVSNQKENESFIKDKAAGFYSFSKGSSPEPYPGSLTGAIALLRQTYYDARWYKENSTKTEYNISLEAFNQLQTYPAIFEANDKYNASRAAMIGKEFGVKYIIKGGGNEYQRISDMEELYSKFIIPVNYPEALDVEDPFDAEQVSLAELKHWEMAPCNAAEMEKHGIPFCFTSADLKERNQFLPNIRKAIKYGLSEKTALKALTTNPALFVNAQAQVGALRNGMSASFFISNKNIFEEDATIYQHWVNGQGNVYEDMNAPDIRGNYQMNIADKIYKVIINGEQNKPAGSVKVDTTKYKLNVGFKNNLATFSFDYDSAKTARLNGNYDEVAKSIAGKGQWSDGNWFDFKMSFVSADTSKPKPADKKEKINYGKVFYPFSAYGEPLPDEGIFKTAMQKFKNRYDAILIKNATVWTNEGDSVLKEYDVYVTEGKIVRIAPNIDAPKLAFAVTIDAMGKHLTPGIIDEHSHIALSGGVNEWAQASSAEVRMGDVVNPEDINIYRQLSGGVTTAQLLHGSSNPIGGQSQIIKLRWGLNGEEMKYQNAPGFIKFALGENVKQGNSPPGNRFPQTRMGVEQVYIDIFTRAKNYKKTFDDFGKIPAKQKTTTIAPRKDLELEAIAEILDGKRNITCHSYVQSEINMLLHVADSMKFKVNTFTHILEGYKVADKMKAHGANASTFADWWAYKLEVMEAIPYNSAILTKMGVNTCINSDDAEMGRRLNQEAAKGIKYGGLTETEALKLATLNPAKALHIDDKVGSIKVGKVADLVLWSDNPLSIYAKAEKTIVDGQIYFDRDEDAKLREQIKKERARIIAKLIIEKNKGGKVVKPSGRKRGLDHCDTIEGSED
jgi:imidazolonepropionase-like amidohydrolase